MTSGAENTISIGTKGEPCECLSNFVKITKEEDVSVFEYHVSFSSGVETAKLRKRVLFQLKHVIGSVSNFDGQALFLPHRLASDETVLNCNHPTNTNEDVLVTVKYIKEKPFEELSQFFNILFRRILTELGFLEIRHGFFELSEVKILPDQNLQVWPGVALTVETKDSGLTVMIDSPSRIVRTDTILDHFVAMKNSNGKDKANLEKKFTDFVTGKIVLCKYSNQCYKIDDVTFELTPRSFFNFRTRSIDYIEYYKLQHNVKIKNLEQPLLLSTIRPRKSCNTAEAIRSVCLVPELCFLTGLTTDHKTNFKVMTEISTITRLNPALKVSAMRELLSRIMNSEKARKILRDWGINLEKDLMRLNGRKIDGPALAFRKDTAKVVQSNFSADSCAACYEPVDIHKFLVVCPGNDVDKARNFITYYRQACASLGIKMNQMGHIIPLKSNTPSSFVKALQDQLDSNVQFVIIIMPNQRDDVYSAVKKQCLCISPIPSQCILSKTLNHRSIKAVTMKICLQINCKLGGSLWALKIPIKKVMFLGMDVAHDPTQKNPSIIALVASLNDDCTKFFSRCARQPIHQEVATSLRIMFIDALDQYRKNNGSGLPDRIIFFRDGGCAGTFDILRKYEVDVCLEVLEAVYLNQLPRFSYICVAKRIPERILLVMEGDKAINPFPGTVVDEGITQPFLYDFYCVSQQTRQGTVNPTHYTILHETRATKPDNMQKLAYVSTFMYYNWQGSIRVPAFIQYAHKLGQLVSRIKDMPNRSMSNSLYYL